MNSKNLYLKIEFLMNGISKILWFGIEGEKALLAAREINSLLQTLG
jgi:hypothetical protein